MSEENYKNRPYLKWWRDYDDIILDETVPDDIKLDFVTSFILASRGKENEIKHINESAEYLFRGIHSRIKRDNENYQEISETNSTNVGFRYIYEDYEKVFHKSPTTKEKEHIRNWVKQGFINREKLRDILQM